MLDRVRIEALVEAVVERLDGEWLLIGGALVALWLEPRRVTEDVDIVGLRGTADERYDLLTLADDLGLPVEAVNSAADFFVRRIAGWKDEIEVWKRGSRSVVYRPTTTLFLLLKMRRLSEQDLLDCRAALDHAPAETRALDRARVAAAIDALDPSDDPDVTARRSTLRAWLS
jgi:hypothetical protein